MKSFRISHTGGVFRFAPAWPLLCTLALFQSVSADTDPHVNSLVYSDKFLVNDGVTKAEPGQVLVERNHFYASPDGSKLAVIGNNADGTYSVWLDGKPGPAQESIYSPQWSSKGSTFLYTGENKGKQTIYKNNIPGESAVLITGLKGIDTTEGLKLFYFASQNPAGTDEAKRKWTATGTKVAEEILGAGEFFPSPDGRSAFILGKSAKAPVSWARDEGFYGVATQFGMNPPVPPAWSPDGKHVAFTVDNGPNHNFIVDTQAAFLVSEATNVAWSPTSDRFIAHALTSMTVVFRVQPDGKTALEYNAKQASAGKPYWTRNGQHYAFYLPRTGELVVDGKIRAGDLHYNAVTPEPSADWQLSEEMRAPQVAVSEDGQHWAATDARKDENGVETTVRWDGTDGKLFDGIYDLKWGTTEGGPVYLARSMNGDEVQWSLVKGTTQHVLSSVKKAEVGRPLGGISFPDEKTARIVMQEGTRIVRYDVALWP